MLSKDFLPESVASERLPSADFPIEWENPRDAQLFWLRESTHFPDIVKPLDFALCVQGIEHGFNHAAQRYGIPGLTYDRLFHGYVYEAVDMPALTAEALSAHLQEALVRIEAVIGSLDQHWQEQWLPEIQQQLAAWEAYDLQNATASQLIKHLQESYKRLIRLWEIHFELFFPMVLAISLFDEFYQELVEEADTFSSYTLLAGFPNKTIETDVALWQLSRLALALPEVRAILLENPPHAVMEQLQQTPTGQQFFAQFQQFLQIYGRRTERWSLQAVPWLEDPMPVIKNLQEHLRQPERDLFTEMQQVTATREQQVERVLQQIKHYPQVVQSEFRQRLQAAQVGYRLKEEHIYWLDFQSIYAMRQLSLACGQRLTEHGLLVQAADIFYLYPTELATIEQGTEAVAHSSWRTLVAQRRAAEAESASITPPVSIGTPVPEVALDDPISRAVGKVMGGVSPSAMPNVLTGCGGAPGVVQGTVKVLRTLEEVPKVNEGDILVVSMITPAWTALFATVAAIITDGGGVLSHGAIVAREYRIPAVVSTRLATSMLQDGQRVEVDGNAGVVRILS